MTRDEFIKAVEGLKADFEQRHVEWENRTVGTFLEAIISYTEDIQGYYDNMNMGVNADEPTWENFFSILKAAAIYE